MSKILTGPDPIDVHVGRKIRQRRLELGLSQEAASAPVFVKFQQLQKYEKAENRVSASVLFKLSISLGVDISYFFDGLDKGANYPRHVRGDEIPHVSDEDMVMNVDLIRKYSRLPKKTRESISHIVSAFSGVAND